MSGLERARVDLLPLVDVDCAPRVAGEARLKRLADTSMSPA
jgi:hypothetical protein